MADPTKFSELETAAKRYGELSLENYSRIRGLAERIASGLCRYMGHREKCVYLVPPDGPWSPNPYDSAAFSVAGQGFLPLAPIAFGLAVRVSESGDWLRLVLECSKSGHDLNVAIRHGRSFNLSEPVDESELQDLFDHLHAHLVGWFNEQSDHYEHGEYGGQDIGFDFLNRDGD